MNYLDDIPNNTIIIGSWSSRCNNCGKPTMITETHEEIVGYGPDNGDPGCGIKFEYEFNEYAYPGGNIPMGLRALDLERFADRPTLEVGDEIEEGEDGWEIVKGEKVE